MRKIIIVFTLLTCILTIGCSQQKEDKIESIKDVYFDVVQKIENNDVVKVETIKESLQEYNYEQDSGTCIYAFNDSNDNETLLIYYNSNEDKTVNKVSYSCKTESNLINLSYEGIDDANRFRISLQTNDINLSEEVCNIVDNKDSNMLNIYNDIAKNMATKNNMSLEDIEKNIGIKPDSHTYKNIYNNDVEVSRDIYEKGKESLTVDYIDSSKKNIGASYTKSEAEGNVLFTKNIFLEELLNDKGEKLSITIHEPVDSFSAQVKITNMFFK
ncbi:hypothetical protein [Terrisporobacter glycolicus]|uniref:Lipoprotein n=1 Tax=Terrisporobacter glycolicus ATCC 14880 = DSM 1288 TaxID=1121315 RepID=A0ABZ2EWJ8_9FIRM|nr:hypothetical protein [Terrisporobacter glycolicus]